MTGGAYKESVSSLNVLQYVNKWQVWIRGFTVYILVGLCVNKARRLSPMNMYHLEREGALYGVTRYLIAEEA
jgi:hypothetical protein